jgi:dolichyl-phosphate beta-glucosyltransferase
LTLVIPVYQGGSFLADSLRQAWGWLANQPRATELLVVDDGSSDASAQIVADFAARHASTPGRVFTPLRNAENRGKGFSIRRAFLHAGGDFVVFTDADLTYPLDNIGVLLNALEAGAEVAYGSRMHAGSRYVVAPSFFGKLFSRHLLGRTFNLLVRMLVVPGVHDTQAGLKGFRKTAAQRLAGRIRLSRFSFDVELFAVARRLGMRVADCPVLFVYRKEPTTVRFVRDSLAMARDMIKVRWRILRGVYDQQPAASVLQELRDGGARPVELPAPTVTKSGAAGTTRQSG